VLAPPIQPPASPSAIQATAEIDPATHQQDALTLRLAMLLSAIEKSGRPDGAGAMVVRSIGDSLSVVICFGDNSSAVKIDENLARALGETALMADHVILRGRTDAAVATPTAGQLALSRALAVKKMLITEGIDRRRVRIFYRAAGAFEADNRAPEGRAANRRVEIELRRS
jgi:outer membrane protein OmpA-like peptidoglycan-associated protein